MDPLFGSKDISSTDTQKGDMLEGSVRAESVKEGSVDDITALDNAILRANGHEAAMPRSFSMLSALGLGFSITNSWIGYLSNFGQNLIYGGPQVVIFGVLVACVVQWIVALGLAELASAFPSSGGQYHFTFILAPKKTRRFAGFVVGWMSILAWWIVTCSGVSLAAVSMGGMITFWKEDFVVTQWMTYLIYVAIALCTVLPLFICPKQIPRLAQATLYLSVLGFFVTFVVVLAMRQQTQPASFITQSGLGTSGWGDGTAWMLGITNGMYAFGGIDGAIHISEEMHQPGKRLPQVINMTLGIGFVTLFPLFLALMFCMTDLDAVVNSTLPSAEVIFQATGSKAVTTFLLSWVILVYVICLSSQWITAGRIAWAFARDNGTPYSKYFSHIDKKRDFPARATVAAVVFVCIYGLLYLASSTAFNSIVTSAVLYLNITYTVPQAILLFQGRHKSLPNRPFNLGYFGYFCNIFSTVWVVVLGVFICFPPGLPVEVGTMNYTSVILLGLFGVIIAFYFTIGKNFQGPNIDWEALNAANALESTKGRDSS